MKPLLTTLLLSLTVAAYGCAAAPAQDEDLASGAGAVVTTTLASITGFHIAYNTVYGPPFDATMDVGASLVKTTEGVSETSLTYRVSPPTAGGYTLTVKNIGADRTAVSNVRSMMYAELPSSVIQGAVGRLVIFADELDGHAKVVEADGLSMYEKLSFDGDKAHYETTTSDGKHLSGDIALPGLASNKAQYTVTVAPRNVPEGSLLGGAHFFRITATCAKAGCIPKDPFAP